MHYSLLWSKGRKAKKIIATREVAIAIKADSAAAVDPPPGMTLRSIFCDIRSRDKIQYSYESPLKVYDPATGALIREMKIKIATRFFKGNEVGILKDSVVTHL